MSAFGKTSSKFDSIKYVSIGVVGVAWQVSSIAGPAAQVDS